MMACFPFHSALVGVVTIITNIIIFVKLITQFHLLMRTVWFRNNTCNVSLRHRWDELYVSVCTNTCINKKL